jgi:Xaa-Pro aminopeptidase
MFADHRKKFFSHMQDGDVAIFAGAKHCVRNHDVDFRFRQQSTFWYLTGCPESDAYLILSKGIEGVPEECLYVLPKDPLQETWHGRRLGAEGAQSKLGFLAARENTSFHDDAVQVISSCKRLWFAVGEGELDALVEEQIKSLRQKARLGESAPEVLLDPLPVISELRLIKSSEEIGLMERAATISANAHLLAMSQAKPGMHEYEIEALMHHYYRAHGCDGDGWAYPSIVASGVNACILHYTENNVRLNANELILIDSGAEYSTYGADITRTFPISNKFTTTQSDIYQVVLNAQEAVIEASTVGQPFHDGHQLATKVLTQGLLDLKILKGSLEDCLAQESYKRFTIHNTSHWLGLDVHDCGAYFIDGVSRPLEPGMVFTVEPGLYFSPDDETIPEHFRGIGVRIEDDILITDAGPKVLTAEVPKKIEEVEEACGI